MQSNIKGVSKPRDENGSLRGAQHRDPTSGRPEIEMVMAYQEPPPPPPRPKKTTTSKPLPWKVKERATKRDASAALTALQDTMWASVNHRKPVENTPSAAPDDAQWNVASQAQLPGSRLGEGPQTAGTARVVRREVGAPFSRDIPAEAQTHTRVTRLGSHLPPPDGRKHVPPIVSHDPSLNVVTLMPKAVAAPPSVTPRDDPTERYDIFGKPIRQPPAATKQTSASSAEAAPPTSFLLGGAEEVSSAQHYAKVMQTNRRVLVDIAKEKAKQRPPTVSDDVPTDIFGRPQAVRSNTQQVARKSMFNGDSEPVKIFDDGKAPLQPMERAKREEMSSFPSYIANPPMEHGPVVHAEDLPTTRVSSRNRPVSGEGKPPVGAAGQLDFATPGLGATPMCAPVAFYQSSVFNKILVACRMWGLRPLRLQLRGMDKNCDGLLARTEFQNALLKASADLSDAELISLMQLAQPPQAPPEGKPSLLKPRDDVAPATVSISRVMDVLRGPDFTVRRRMVSHQAFQQLCKLAKKPTFSLTLEDMINTMDFSAHPLFQPHIRGCMREIMQSFSMAWGDRKSRTSVVTGDDFLAFYQDFSPVIRNENDFIRIMKQMHGIEK